MAGAGGIENHIIIGMPDAIQLADESRAQDVKYALPNEWQKAQNAPHHPCLCGYLIYEK